MKTSLVRSLPALLLISLLGTGQKARAADIFVYDANGTDLSLAQGRKLTEMVKSAVQKMPEHTLMNTADEAEFILQPLLVTRGDEMILRLEKLKEGRVIARTEEPLPSLENAQRESSIATRAVVSGDEPARSPSFDPTFTPTPDHDDSSATESASSTSSAELGEVSSSSAPNPGIAPQTNEDRGFLSAGVGPAFPIGLGVDSVMVNVGAAYTRPFSPTLAGKAFGDLNLGTADDAARVIHFGLGLEADVSSGILPTIGPTIGASGHPYLVGDLGYAFARDNDSRTSDGTAIGAGAGYRFRTNELSALEWDVNLHYTWLTSEIQGENPSLLSLKAALNF